MVELLPLDQSEDLDFVEDILKRFNEKTGSEVASKILEDWPAKASSFTKVSFLFY